MDSDDYTKRELEMMFAQLSSKLDDIRADIVGTNKHFDIRLSKVENKVEHLDESIRGFESLKTKALAIWSVGIVVVGYILNRFFQ